MTPTRLRECLDALGWSQRCLAETLGLHETRVRRWARGSLDIPKNVVGWLERLAETHEAHPLPDGWTRSGNLNRSPSIKVRVYDGRGVDQPSETAGCHSATEAVDAVLERKSRYADTDHTVVISTLSSCSDQDQAELRRQSAAEGMHLNHTG